MLYFAHENILSTYDLHKNPLYGQFDIGGDTGMC